MTTIGLPPKRFASSNDQLHDLVVVRTGFSNFGGDEYAMGLRALLQSMDYDPIFTPVGRIRAWDELIRALSARALAVQAMKDVPSSENIDIRKPVVIVGIPRTGTTALHKLMALDPQFQGLQTWLTNSPMPRPPRETWIENEHFKQTEATLEAIFTANPSARAAHNIVADEVDECLEILRQGFVSNRWASSWSASNYDAWWQTQSELPSYQYLKRILQVIGSNEPRTKWLLKNPGHIANLDLLFAVFPDACVIQTHRDPSKAIPSLCQLLMQSHRVSEVGRVRQRSHIMGMRETEKWAKAVRDAEPVRERHRDQIIDIIHGDLHRNPLQVVDRIYAKFDLQLSPRVKEDMARRAKDAPEASHGVHRYKVSDFGLTRDEILDRFGDYVDRFDLRTETGELSVGAGR